MASRELCKQGEERCGFEVERRNGHQSRERERRFADGGDKLADLTDRATAFLRLFTDIDLDIHGRASVRFHGFADQRVEEGGAIDRMNCVEQLHRFRCFVGLQPSDAVKPDVGVMREQRRPFAKGFLDAAFAELPLAGRDQLFDLLDGSPLAYRDQRDFGRIAPSQKGRSSNAVEDGFSAVGGGNQNLKAVPMYTAWLSRRSSLSADARSRSIS